MKPGEIAELVDRGLELRKRIAEDTAELKKIEEKLKAAGYEAGLEGDHEELKDANREGKRWLARGSAMVLPVVFTSDKLLGEFRRNTDVHRAIEAIAGDKLTEFFKPVSKFENRFDNGLKFRARAEEVFGKSTGPSFVTACLARDKHGVAKSDVKIAWDDVEPAGRKA